MQKRNPASLNNTGTFLRRGERHSTDTGKEAWKELRLGGENTINHCIDSHLKTQRRKCGGEDQCGSCWKQIFVKALRLIFFSVLLDRRGEYRRVAREQKEDVLGSPGNSKTN